MIENPFTSDHFGRLWLEYFHRGSTQKGFDFIENVNFLRPKGSLYYFNLGKNLTKGVHYRLTDGTQTPDRPLLIYDVPEYAEPNTEALKKGLKLIRVKQYPGFLIDLQGINATSDYINQQFSGKNRREFRSNQRRLEACFNISYDFIKGEISAAEHQRLFERFKELLVRRYSDKEMEFHYLEANTWEFIKTAAYDFINTNRASLLVINHDEQPIGLTLNFHSENILFETLTVFDPDYYKFSIGKLSVIKLIDWCIANEVQISDFSKGDFDYKRKWANKAYQFEYHIIYNKASILSTLIARSLAFGLNLKRFLRERGLNQFYRKIRYKTTKQTENDARKWELSSLVEFDLTDQYKSINPMKADQAFLRKFLFTFLFANPQPLEEIKVYKRIDNEEYIICGKDSCLRIS